MKIIRWAAAVVGVAAALTVAAPANAEDDTAAVEYGGLTVTQAACEDGGQITISGEGISYHVISGVRTAGLAARLDGEVYAQTQADHDNGQFTVGEGEELVVPAPEGAGMWTLEFRWFAGPQRDDLPAWKVGPADGEAWDAVVEAIEALQDAEQRHWDARDTAEFVTWFEVEVFGCPPEPASEPDGDPSASPSGGPVETGSPAPGVGGEQLPVTGSSLLPTLLILGSGGLAAGLVLHRLSRSRGVTFHA